MVVAVEWDLEPVCTVLPQEKDDRLKLMQPWRFRAIYDDRPAVTHIVPTGFRFEGSVPRVFWRIVTPTDPAAWAGFCAHDWAYLLVKIGLIDRADADRILYLALRRNGFGWAQSRAVYSAVRSFGWVYAGADLTDTEKEELELSGIMAYSKE